MSKPTPLTSLRVEDYPSEQRKWLPRLFIPLNQFLTSTTNILNGRVDFGVNVPCLDSYLQFTYQGTPQKLMWTLTNQPKIVWVGQAYESNTAIRVEPLWSYDSSTSSLNIDFLKLDGASLTVGTEYKIFIRGVP